jgi:hypothetical protein
MCGWVGGANAAVRSRFSPLHTPLLTVSVGTHSVPGQGTVMDPHTSRQSKGPTQPGELGWLGGGGAIPKLEYGPWPDTSLTF